MYNCLIVSQDARTTYLQLIESSGQVERSTKKNLQKIGNQRLSANQVTKEKNKEKTPSSDQRTRGRKKSFLHKKNPAASGRVDLGKTSSKDWVSGSHHLNQARTASHAALCTAKRQDLGGFHCGNLIASCTILSQN